MTIICQDRQSTISAWLIVNAAKINSSILQYVQSHAKDFNRQLENIKMVQEALMLQTVQLFQFVCLLRKVMGMILQMQITMNINF